MSGPHPSHPPPPPDALPFSGDRPVALVTGGAKRTGRAISLRLAERGADVLLTFLTSRDEARAACDEIRSRGVAAAAVQMDLRDPRGVREQAERLADLLPRLDVLVHNASVYEPTPLETAGDGRIGQLERHHAVNAFSPFMLQSVLAPVLTSSTLPGGGAIVAMLDIHTEPEPALPRRGHAAYAMSKASLGALVRASALDLAPKVRVNGVAPGVIAWPESGPESDAEMQARYLARVPLERSGTPEEAAGAVAFLALDATYTTGQVLRVDGGRALR